MSNENNESYVNTVSLFECEIDEEVCQFYTFEPATQPVVQHN